MYFLFLFTILAGASYFVFAPRRFDFLSVFFFSGVMYMSFAITGSVEFQSLGLSYTYTPRSYAIIVTFFLVLLAGTIVRDLLAPPAARAAPPAYVEDPDASNHLAMVAAGGVLLGAGCIALYVLNDPWLVLADDKTTVLDNTGSRPRSYAEMFTIHAIVAAYLSRRHFLLAAAAALALFILFIGHRFAVVMSVLGILVAASARSPAVRALYRRRVFCVGCIAAVLVLTGYRMFRPVVFMSSSETLHLFDNIVAGGLSSVLTFNEAAGPALIFLAGLEAGIHLGYGHFLSALPSLLVFMAEAGIDVQSYNDYVEGPVLAEIPGKGLADSNLGSWYAVGGMSAVVIFSCAYTGLVIFLSSLMHRARRSRSLYLAWLPILTFYNFRNDFAQVFYLSKQAVLTWLLLAGFAAIVVAANRSSAARPGVFTAGPPRVLRGTAPPA